MLIDTARIVVRGGAGGNGCLSFRREKFVPKGGPNGGDGGDGGSVIFEAAEGSYTLLDFHYRRHYRAESGQHGGGSDKRGRNGEDVVLRVPVGTVIRDHETGDVLADLDAPGARQVVGKGGRGGRGNARFTTSTDRAPRRVEQGQSGEERTVDLELKLMADVGIVGAPNAGKSTLLTKVSAARPRVADFPFTTLSPVLGLVQLGVGRSFVMADLPGLIEGAHEGKGLGHRFLKHTERTGALLVLLDAADDPEAAYRTLMDELTRYGQGLSEKPRIVALNKMDLVTEVGPTPTFGGEQVFRVSALRGEGLKELLEAVWQMFEEHR